METGNADERAYVKCAYPGCDAMCWTWPAGDDYNDCACCGRLFCQKHGLRHCTMNNESVCNLCYDELTEEEHDEMEFVSDLDEK